MERLDVIRSDRYGKRSKLAWDRGQMRLSRRHRTGIAALSIGLLLAAAACSDESDGPPDSGLPSRSEVTDDTSAKPTPSEPTVIAPTLPPEADGTSPAAAKAFARHVVDLINYAGQTRDLDPLRAAFGDGCQVCHAGIQGMEELVREGARVEGGQWSISYIRYVPERPRDEPLIDIVIKATVERIFHPGESKPDVNPGFESNYSWYLKYTEADGWVLDDWRKVD